MSGGAEWSLRYSRRAEKDIGRLDRPVRRRILEALSRLATEPERATGIRRLSGRAGSRLRVGDWRVLFELDSAKREVVVDRVLPRGRAYER
jgi:Cytotoxic translational repressor of toxin-antitoxin stability system